MKRVRQFNPDTVVFLAGVTPDRGPDLGLDRYRQVLERVQQELHAVTTLEGINHLTYLSSGIAGMAIGSGGNKFREVYRLAKLTEENLVTSLSDSLVVHIVRIFSLTGPHARDPRRYAFFDLIEQCKAGRIELYSQNLVYRSYVSVTDLAAAILRSSVLGIGGVSFTGGEPLELADLANRIVETVNPQAEVIVRQYRQGIDDYVGPDLSWRQWCVDVGLAPQDLSEQISSSERWLESKRGA
jgi:nucleoside-diphosphate-sugar epimerase